MTIYRQWGKRCLDCILVVPALILALPVMMACALLVRVKLGTPILFCQRRPGLHGRPFLLFKFRTMTNVRDASGNLLPDGNRLPPFGNWLRKISLDELPELFNVLKGNMSLVGPRPLLMRYLDHYSPSQARRHEVKPGLTGWAQVNGRNAVTWDKKFALDVWYVDHLSFWLDVKIMVLTFWQIIRRKDISQSGHATMPEFTGNAPQDLEKRLSPSLEKDVNG